MSPEYIDLERRVRSRTYTGWRRVFVLGWRLLTR